MSGLPKRIALVLGLLLATSSCREVAGPEARLAPHRAVYAVLEVGTAEVAVLVEALSESGGRGPLRDAQVSVSGPSGSVTLSEAAPGPPVCFTFVGEGPVRGEDGCYTGLLPQAAAGGEGLTLNMVLPDGGRVRGGLVTPDLPIASIPADSQRVVPYTGARLPNDHAPRAIVPIMLHEAQGAWRVDVVATVVRSFPGGSPEPVDPHACTIDQWTGPYLAPRLDGKHDWYLYELPTCRPGTVLGGDSVDLAMHVIAMDQNYAGYFNHVLGSSSISEARAGFGLEGAVGVFGAVATTVLPLRLVYVE